MKNFEIDMQYVTSVNVREEHYPKQWQDESEEEFLIRKLKYGSDPIVSLSSIDHPEFTKLREQLGKDGFISIERGWWNGDRVLKPFTLNGVKFKKGYKFCSACAMKWTLEHGSASL